MGVASLGHRITLLKSIYDVKIAQGVVFEPGEFVPMCKSPATYALF